jgi:hypothetical protein
MRFELVLRFLRRPMADKRLRIVYSDVFKLALFLFRQFEEVGHIKESVAFQTDVDKGRLHPRQDAGDAAFIDGTG